MNTDENNWNTNNTGNTTNNDDTWNTNSNGNGNGNTTNNSGTWNTNTTGNTTNGANSTNSENINVSTKNRMTALMLCWFLGLFGVHRLYAGKLGSGFLFLYGTVVSILLIGLWKPIGLMCIVTMVALVANDFAFLAFGQFKDCYGKTICSDKLQ